MMKKSIIITLALMLALSLAACGGGNNAPSTGGDNAPLTRDGGDTPLTRNGDSQAQTPDASVTAPGLDMGAIMSGNGTDNLLSGYDAATRQAMIEEAKEDGYDMTFGADGSMTLTDQETGEVIVQNPDGTWDFSDADGSSGNFGGDWPDNEYTRMIPKPEMEIMATLVDADEFTAAFSNASVDQLKAYVEQLKAKGFTVGAQTQDQEVMGMVIYIYSAKNADGWEVEATAATGTVGLTVRKP